jgi:hypothetical protein
MAVISKNKARAFVKENHTLGGMDLKICGKSVA